MHFFDAADATLHKLAGNPELGRICRFRNPRLRGLRSFRVAAPFEKILIFYRVEGPLLQAIRLMHGARDLPQRLAERPGA